jgi:hypothetical protein
MKPGEEGESENAGKPRKVGSRSYSPVPLPTDTSQSNKNYKDSELHITMFFEWDVEDVNS